MNRAQQNFWENSQRVYQVLGCLIFASVEQRKVGYIFTHAMTQGGEIELPQPFAAIGPATRDEYREQCQILNIPTTGDCAYHYFTKAVTE